MESQISSLHAQTGNVVHDHYVAGIAQGLRIIVRTVPTMAVHATFAAVDRIDRMEWSQNGQFILAIVKSQGIVQVFSLTDPEWSCRIDTGLSGLSEARFHPTSSRHILVYADFGLRMDIWNIETQTCQHVKYVKNAIVPRVSNNGRFGALVCRHESLESILIADMTSGESMFSIVKSFSMSVPTDLVNLVWSADDTSIIAVGSPVHSDLIKLDIHSGTVDGISLVGAKELGTRVVAFNKHTLIVGGFDESVRIFSIKSSLSLLAAVSLRASSLDIIADCPVVFRESLFEGASERDRNTFDYGGPNHSGHAVQYREVVPHSYKISLPSVDALVPSTHATARKVEATGPPRAGVCAAKLAPSGPWLAVQTDEKASVLFIVDLVKLKVVQVLIHRQPVRSFEWNPSRKVDEVAITSGDSRVFLWSPDYEQRTIELKDSALKLTSAFWTRTGESLLVCESERICCVSLDHESEHLGG